MAEKAKSGDPLEIPAQVWNDLIDLRNDAKRNGSRTGTGAAGSEPPTDYVKLENSTGADVPAGGALEWGDYLLTDAQRQYLWLDGVSPADDQRDYFALFPVALKDTDIGRALVAGVGIFKVTKVSDYHKYVKLQIAAGEGLFASDYFGSDYFGDGYFTTEEGDRPKLYSDWFGAGEILAWCDPAATGEQWAIVRMGSRTWPTYYGKLDDDTVAGQKGTVSFWSGTHGSETDSLANIENVLTRVADLSAGDPVYVSWVGGPDNGGPEMVLIC